MRFFTPFRIASYLLVLFCTLHTVGGMLAQNSLGLAADAVFEGMKRVHFDFNGSDATWYGFWFGFGITTSIFLLLSGMIAWQLDAVPPESWRPVGPIAWALFAAHVANTIISWKYFFSGPAVFGVLISLLIAAGAYRKRAVG
jgi:hypothetical protein